MPIRIVTPNDAQAESEKGNLFGLPDADPSIEQKPEGLSFCLIMKNEERFLSNCLKSIASVADEICVVDTGSTDRSIEIAQGFGARIEAIEWPRDFAKARNVSLAMARYRWILTLDADEEITPQSLYALEQVKRAPASLTAVMCRIQNKTKEADGGDSTFSHYLPRLFSNTTRLRYKGAVHERLVIDLDRGAVMVDSPITILHYGYQEDVLIDRDKTNRNLPLIEREAEENPEDTFCLFNLAMLRMSLGKIDESIETFEKMFDIAKRKKEAKNRAYFAPAYLTLAMEYYRSKGEYEKSMELIDSCLDINQYYPNALYFKANLFAIKGKHDEARACLKKAVDAQEFIKAYAFVDEEICLWKAKYYLGLSYAGTNEFTEALDWLDRAAEARGSYLEIRLARARVLEAMGNKVEAEFAFAAIANDFDNDEAILEYATCLMRLGRFSKLLELVNRETQTRNTSVCMQLYLAATQAAHRLGRTDTNEYLAKALAIEKHPHAGKVIQALEQIYQALGLEAERKELRDWEIQELPPCCSTHDFTRRAARWIELNEFAKALEVAKVGLERAPEDPHLILNAAIAESRLDESESAISRLGSLDPYINLEIYLVGSYLRALLQHRAGQSAAALDSLEGLLKWKPDQVDALLMRARLLAAESKISEAESLYRLAMNYDRARAGVELAGLYLRLGRFQAAQEAAEDAMQLAGAAG